MLARSTWLAGTIVAAALAGGCAKTQTTLEPPPPAPKEETLPDAALASNVRERVKNLQVAVAEYAQGAQKLPGRNEAENRAQVAQQFTLLSQILASLAGNDVGSEFKQQLRIVENSRAVLSSGSAELATEPTIDTGLRAAHRALASINSHSFTDAPDIAKSLDLMKAKIDDLDSVRGAMHRLVAGQAFNASSEAIRQMSATIDSRINEKPSTPAKPS